MPSHLGYNTFSNKSATAYNNWPQRSARNELLSKQYTGNGPEASNWRPASLDPTFAHLVHFPALEEQELDFLSMYSQPLNGNFIASGQNGTAQILSPPMNTLLKKDPSPISENLNTSVNNTPSTPLVCPWDGCKRPGPFATKGSLDRHVQTQHVAPRAFKCPQAGCNRSFSRKDNLNQHCRAVHHHVIRKGAPRRVARLA